MAEPIIAQAISLPRMGQMLKIKDLHEESNLKSNIDLIAVIAKIGEMKMATQTSRGSVPAREIYLCDDSWAMIKLIARDYFAETSVNFKADQVIYIRNVKPMKLRGYTVLATMPDTLLNHEVNTPEAISLKCWLSDNNLDFKQDGLKDLLFKRFTNLSTSNEIKNSTAGLQENKDLSLSQPSQSPNLIAASQTIDANDIKNNFIVNALGEKKRKLSDEVGNVNVKVIKVDLRSTLMSNGTKLNNAIFNDSSSQKAYSDTSETFSKDNETVIISVDSGDESTGKSEKKETCTKKVLEDGDIDVDHDKDSIISETYSALMRAESQWSGWNVEKDKYLVNYLSKYCFNLRTGDTCLKLHQANLNVFHGLTVDELRTRVDNLASVRNYVYLLQLCGGKEIKSEKEKCIFIERVEELRRFMKIKEFKEVKKD